MAIFVLFFSLRSPKIKEKLKSIFNKKPAVISSIVLFGFIIIAFLDSIHFYPSIEHSSSESTSKVFYSPHLHSLLDTTLGQMGKKTEKTYSAPLAKTLYIKAFIEQTDGQVDYTYAPLKHPEQHLLGTDQVGQDILYLSLKSIRTALIIGTLTTFCMIPFSLLFGISAGYFGGIVDDIIQYIYTTLSSIPGVLLIAASILSVQTFIANHAEWFTSIEQIADIRLLALCIILGITSWTSLCRVLRAETLKIRESDFVQAAKTLGTSSWGILHKHILPNVMHLVLITAVLDFSFLILSEAVLSYVGVGVAPTTASFGNMINAARLELAREPVVWWPIVSAFSFMFILVLSSNIFSDAVRDALDPRLNHAI